MGCAVLLMFIVYAWVGNNNILLADIYLTHYTLYSQNAAVQVLYQRNTVHLN